ncbi:MAG TPA: hypothetical protein VHD57_09980 [Vicinamibacterales bacterium]|jgi:hypothetical protein|nr:hypothetical protein [Vicinamibacterales bacterium]
MRRLAVILMAAALAGACGKDGGSPAAPSAPQISAIAVTGSDLVNLGRTASYSAAMTGGSAACSWGDDAPQVGTISSSGVLTGVGNGKVTIWCDAAGVRGTKLIQVLATYTGSWVGSYAVTSCSESGDFQGVGVCDQFQNGHVFPLSGSFTQAGTTMTGAFALGQVGAGAVTTSVGPDGSATFTEINDGTDVISLRSQWEVHQVQDGKITGHVTLTFTAGGYAGSAVVQADIFNTNRTTGLSTSALATSRAPVTFRTIDDVLQALRR